MPNSTKKRKFADQETETEKKKRERLTLACEIEERGIRMDPCSYCREEKRKCILDRDNPQHTRCSECVRARRACDAVKPLIESWESEVPRVSDWEALDRQMERLDEQEEEALSRQEEALAKLRRLRKQKDFLKARRAKMRARGLQYLDELDALEEKERKEAEEAAKEAVDEADPPGPSSQPVFFFDDPNLFPFPWEDPGVDGEMLQANPGS